MVHGQQDLTVVAHSAVRTRGAEGAAWRRMEGHVPAETLSCLLLLPYFAVAILVTAAITLLAQLSRRRYGRRHGRCMRMVHGKARSLEVGRVSKFSQFICSSVKELAPMHGAWAVR